jgi:hypothetical protein
LPPQTAAQPHRHLGQSSSSTLAKQSPAQSPQPATSTTVRTQPQVSSADAVYGRGAPAFVPRATRSAAQTPAGNN